MNQFNDSITQYPYSYSSFSPPHPSHFSIVNAPAISFFDHHCHLPATTFPPSSDSRLQQHGHQAEQQQSQWCDISHLLQRRRRTTSMLTASSPFFFPSTVLKKPLALFSQKPMTGFYRDGYCRVGQEDSGNHAIAGAFSGPLSALSVPANYR